MDSKASVIVEADTPEGKRFNSSWYEVADRDVLVKGRTDDVTSNSLALVRLVRSTC